MCSANLTMAHHGSERPRKDLCSGTWHGGRNDLATPRRRSGSEEAQLQAAGLWHELVK